MLTVITATLVVSVLTIGLGLPYPSWLYPLEGVPQFRALPYVLPALAHGSVLACCWLLGALSANAFEAGAFRGTLAEALSRTWRGGAFSTGLLLLSTQWVTFVTFSAEGLDPYLGASHEVDVRLINIANELVVDVAASAVALTAFRIWWDAKQYFGD